MLETSIVKVLKEGPATVPEMSASIHRGRDVIRSCVNRLKKRGVIREFGTVGTNSTIWELADGGMHTTSTRSYWRGNEGDCPMEKTKVHRPREARLYGLVRTPQDEDSVRVGIVTTPTGDGPAIDFGDGADPVTASPERFARVERDEFGCSHLLIGEMEPLSPFMFKADAEKMRDAINAAFSKAVQARVDEALGSVRYPHVVECSGDRFKPPTGKGGCVCAVVNKLDAKEVKEAVAAETERCCKAMCRYCMRDVKVDEAWDGVRRVFTHQHGGTWEYCEAAAIRSRSTSSETGKGEGG